MRADVSTNSCTNLLKTNDDLGGSPPHPHDMAAANRTLSCDRNKTSSILMNALKASDFGPDLLMTAHRRHIQRNKLCVSSCSFKFFDLLHQFRPFSRANSVDELQTFDDNSEFDQT